MNEKQMGEALLKWDVRGPAPEVDPQRVVASVLSRDQRTVRSLAMLAAALWILTAVGIPVFFKLYMQMVFPKANWLVHEMISHERGATPQELSETADMLTAATIKMGTVFVTGSVAALVLAAITTIGLVFAARRATLRQVNANLSEIAEQLKRLQPAAQ